MNDKDNLTARPKIRIRPLEDRDADQVRELVWNGMCVDDDSPLQVALKLENLIHLPLGIKFGLGAILTVTLGLEAASAARFGVQNVLLLRVGGRNLTLLLIAIALAAWLWVGYRRERIKQCIVGYVTRMLDEDMPDLRAFYTPRPSDDPEQPDVRAFWVAEVDEGMGQRVAGCIGIAPHQPSGPFTAELRRLSVSSSHRRLGIASLLLEASLLHAKENGLKKVGLGVSAYQAPAIGLYLRKGFEAVKKTRGLKCVLRWVL
ncbi:hypothetical protein MD484_g7686, partial [Candolleomyces efflorescens]